MPDDSSYIKTIECSNWKDFLSKSETLSECFIWRGHREHDWKLTAALFRDVSGQNSENIVSTHLKNFMYACRGRLTTLPSSRSDENGWWALGQHYLRRKTI